MRYQILAFSVSRMVLNTGYRLVYPFLPALARGLGVDLQTMALAITARSLLGFFTPLFGGLADTRGRRWVMLAGLVLFAAGFVLVPVGGLFAVFLLGLLISMAGKLLFDPAMQAYLGDRVTYQRRGLALATTELGWSMAGLVGLPLVALSMDRSGWQAPFLWLAGLGMASFVAIRILVPSDSQSGRAATSSLASLKFVVRHVPALAGLSVGILASMANEIVNIVYGVWMEGAFGLQLTALGAAAAVIGLAELSGEGFVAGLSDRLGKKRLVAGGIAASVATSLALPLLGLNPASATVGLFLFYLTFEIVIVASIPLMTELVPSARATTMASNVAGLSLGRAAGALLGPTLYTTTMLPNGIAAAAINGLALLVLLRFVQLPEEGFSRPT